MTLTTLPWVPDRDSLEVQRSTSTLWGSTFCIKLWLNELFSRKGLPLWNPKYRSYMAIFIVPDSSSPVSTIKDQSYRSLLDPNRSPPIPPPLPSFYIYNHVPKGVWDYTLHTADYCLPSRPVHQPSRQSKCIPASSWVYTYYRYKSRKPSSFLPPMSQTHSLSSGHLRSHNGLFYRFSRKNSALLPTRRCRTL